MVISDNKFYGGKNENQKSQLKMPRIGSSLPKFIVSSKTECLHADLIKLASFRHSNEKIS